MIAGVWLVSAGNAPLASNPARTPPYRALASFGVRSPPPQPSKGEGGRVRRDVGGGPADGAAARVLAEAHRAHISRWFFECTPEIHRGLAVTYVTDPRFTQSYDEEAPWLATFVREAIEALYAGRTRTL